MYIHAKKSNKKIKNKAAAYSTAQRTRNVKQGPGFVDDRPEAKALESLHVMMNKSPIMSKKPPEIPKRMTVPTQRFSKSPHLMRKGREFDMRGNGPGEELDVRKGVLPGALLGGLAGAGIGALIGSIVPGIGTGIGALVGGALGALGGALAGHFLSCSASATGVSLGASGPINTGRKYGLRTPIIIRGTELADVLDSELVGASIDHTGSMAARPSARSNNSGFMPADNIPDDRHTSSIANHLSYYDNHGGDGSYSRLQMDLYKIPKCKINTPQSMSNSGYRIKRTVKREGAKVVGIVTKTAEAVTIGSHSSSKGLTAKKEAKVTLRE